MQLKGKGRSVKAGALPGWGLWKEGIGKKMATCDIGGFHSVQGTIWRTHEWVTEYSPPPRPWKKGSGQSRKKRSLRGIINTLKKGKR